MRLLEAKYSCRTRVPFYLITGLSILCANFSQLGRVPEILGETTLFRNNPSRVSERTDSSEASQLDTPYFWRCGHTNIACGVAMIVRDVVEMTLQRKTGFGYVDETRMASNMKIRQGEIGSTSVQRLEPLWVHVAGLSAEIMSMVKHQ
jgi:hypothetical protein